MIVICVIDRRDQTINLCEMKFSQGEFEITKQYDEHLRKRSELFRSATKTRKALHQTFVTTYGLKRTCIAELFRAKWYLMICLWNNNKLFHKQFET